MSSSNPSTATMAHTLSLHDALPISGTEHDHGTEHQRRYGYRSGGPDQGASATGPTWRPDPLRSKGSGRQDRKSTRLNSSHVSISYAVFCLKKKMQAAYANLHTDQER